MKILKIIGIVVAALFAGLVLIGIFAPSGPKSNGSSSTAKAQTNSEPVAAFRADQCIDGVCVAPVQREMASLNWMKAVQEYEFNDAQKQRGDDMEESFLKECIAVQTATWGSDAKDACKAIAFADSSIRRYLNHHIQISAVIKQFSGNVPPTCLIGKNEIEIIGRIETETGRVDVKFQFDKNGKLQVFRVDKSFPDLNEASRTILISKLKVKHPYLQENPIYGQLLGDKGDYSGIAPWGGKVTLDLTQKAPNIKMEAPKAEFAGNMVAACNAAKQIGVL